MKIGLRLGALLAVLVVIPFFLSVSYTKEIPDITEPIWSNPVKLTDRNINTTVDAKRYDLCLMKWSIENAKCKKENKEYLKNTPSVDPACTGICANLQEFFNSKMESQCSLSLLQCTQKASHDYQFCLIRNFGRD